MALPQQPGPRTQHGVDQVLAVLHGGAGQRRRLGQQGRRDRVRPDVDRRVRHAQRVDPCDEVVAVPRPQGTELRRREMPRLALVDRALTVVAELGGADERDVREHLVEPAAGPGRSTTTVGTTPAARRKAIGEMHAGERSHRQVGAVGRHLPSAVATADLALALAHAGGIAHDERCIDHRHRRRVRPAFDPVDRLVDAARPTGVEDTARWLDGDDTRLVRRRAGTAETPGEVDAEDAHGQSRAYWATTSAALSSVRSASASPVGGTPITQRVKPISA